MSPLRPRLGALLIALGLLAAGPAPAGAVFDGADEARSSLALDGLGRVAARPATRAAVRALPGARVTYGRYGTPASLAPAAGRAALAEDLPGDDAVARARAFLRAQPGLFGLDAEQVAGLEVLHDRPLGDHGRAVLLRQRFGGLPAGGGTGQVAVALRDDDVLYASSTLAPTAATPAPATLSAQDAYVRAARALGLDVDGADVSGLRREGDFGAFDVRGVDVPGRTRLVAMPLADGTVRAAFQAVVADAAGREEPLAATTYVDARTGALLQRTDDVDQAADDPVFGVFPNTPPLDDVSAADTRQRWCARPADGCDRVLEPGQTPERSGDWDTVQPVTPDEAALSTGATIGNAARSEDGSDATPLAPGGTLTPLPITTPLQRDYVGAAPFTNAWRRARCNPAGLAADPSFPDVDAAEVNLFAAHNRMHDYAYRLGFTEAAYNLQVANFGRGGAGLDPELGDVQAGALVGTVQDQVAGRNNANQIALDDGIPGITNMYLWQPIAGAFYGVCSDGDFDMSIVGHEYTHAISNRMVGGPSGGLDTTEGGSMGESFSDLVQLEYLMSHGFGPAGDASPYAVGAYVTGNRARGIRDFSMDPERNPLNYSDLGFDLTGVEVHADGEVWNAVNMELRRAMQRRYDGQFPSSDLALQTRCADEDGVDPATCPGDRRYLQIMFDAFLLMQPDVSMVTARDAYLAADRARFGGADQDVIWDAFARRGLGGDAQVDPQNLDPDFAGTDVSPTPSFSSPVADDDVPVTFAPSAPDAELYVGAFEARATPVADTVAVTTRDDVELLRPGTYDFVARADGFGARRFRATIPAGGPVRLEVPMAANLASANAGATVTGDASPPPGDPLDPASEPGDPAALLRGLVDDHEATNWAHVVGDGTIAGTQVTVDLAGGEQTVGSVDVSALLRAQDPNDAGGDTVAQNRFTALRQFALEACTAGPGQDCSTDDAFRRFYESPADAFPGVRPRPAAPDLTLRSFDVPDTRMTHLRMVVLTNQCTGGPDFQGDQDNDPLQDSDCPRGSDRDLEVRAAELQARGADAAAPAPVAVVPGGAGSGSSAPTATTATTAATVPAPARTTPAPAATTGTAATGPAATPCVDATGFRSVAVRRAAGPRLRLGFATTAPRRPVDVDVFAVSRGRLVLGERLVARFRGRPATFTWDGRATAGRPAVRDGYYVVRLRTANATGPGADLRRVALRRSGGRFTALAAFQDRARCGLLRAVKLERPVFGGRRNAALGVSFAVAPPAAVTVEVLRGSRVVRTSRRGTVGAATTQRVRVPSERLARGTYRVRVTAVRGGVREMRTLTARRL